MTALIGEVDSSLTEDGVDLYLRLGCTTFNLDSWCQKNVYPNIHEIFLALRSNKTDDIICERLTLCHFRVVSITGDILFADGDVLYTIREQADHTLQHVIFGTVSHPELPNGIISGLACSVDYCAVLLSVENSTGGTTYGTTALQSSGIQIHHLLPAGDWYGPWFDIITQEFWMATGTAKELNFGIFDPQFGNWEKKVIVRLRTKPELELLSGQILDRILYYTLRDDPHVYRIDLTLHISRGNYSCPVNTMLAGNLVTNELYGYAPGPQGIWRWDHGGRNRTTVGVINLTGALPIPSSTINPIDNTMWISLWGSSQDAWLRVDLKKTTENIGWAPTGNLDGLFDFNPYTIKSEEK